MKGNLKKIVCTSLLLLVVGVGIGKSAFKAFAATNWDAVYKEAYDSVVLAQNSQGQEDINKARVAIRKMTPTWMRDFVGEFSNQVDKIQQKIFVNFYKLLYVDGDPKKPKPMIPQWDIDEARTFIEGFKGDVSNLPYVPAWSQAVDEHQRKHIAQTIQAIDKVKVSKNLQDAYEAYWKVDSLTNVIYNDAVSNFAKDLMKDLHEVIGSISKDTLEAIKFMEFLDILDIDKLNEVEIATLRQQLQDMKVLADRLDDTMKNSLLDRISFCEENMKL